MICRECAVKSCLTIKKCSTTNPKPLVFNKSNCRWYRVFAQSWCLFWLFWENRTKFYNIHSAVPCISWFFFIEICNMRAQNENHAVQKGSSPGQCHSVYVIMMSLLCYRINANIKIWYPKKPHILRFTWIPSTFFLRSLCTILLMNIHYFPNAPRICHIHSAVNPVVYWHQT